MPRPLSSHPVSAERWRQLEPLLDAALDLAPNDRPAFLHAACGGDAALRAELALMVAGCTGADPLLDALLARSAPERFAALVTDGAARLPRALAERFHVVRELGRGGMATVYLARDVKHGRDVAVKMLRPELGAVLGAQRFLAEIRVTANLRHPHILPLFDSGEDEGRLYYVMPYVEGGSLRERIARGGLLPLASAVRIARQLAGALADAHARGIVHRDIKPENVLLTRDGDHAYLADFGIALAAGPAGDVRATAPGFVVGTPAYMSPEQARGGPYLDGRSDVYSLGCVLHEMLTGAPPPRVALGTGDAAPDAAGAALPPGDVRGRVPGWVEAVVQRAVAAAPADRFQTAGEFAHALDTAATPVPERVPARVTAPTLAPTSAPTAPRAAAHGGRWARVPRRALAMAAAMLALVGVVASVPSVRSAVLRGGADAGVDPDVVAVIPFRHEGAADGAALTGDDCARLLYDALARWQTLRFSDEMRVYDARRRRGPGELTIEGARALAQGVGAGRFVWGDVSDQNGALRISAGLYDGRRGTPVTHVVYVKTPGEVAGKFGELADSLVAKLVGTPAAAVGALGTRNFDALRRYAEGYAALHRWNTDLAERSFRAATELDPSFAQASLALAQAMAWGGGHPPPAWREAAARAVGDSGALAPRDRLLARALLAMAEWRMADACTAYRALLARDPHDFAAHLGLGDCLSNDRLVVPDPASPTRWRFRSGLHAAIAEYAQALRLVPSYLEGSRVDAFARLTNRVLFTELGDFRRGFALAPDTVWMRAYPELVHDTLAFRPVPAAPSTRLYEPPTHREAVAANQRQLRDFAAQWVHAFPTSATALEHYAEALEVTGALDTLDQALRTPGALRLIVAARRQRAEDDESAVRRAAVHVRILLKLGRFGPAQMVAESALAAQPAPGPREAGRLAPLAALTGRARLTAGLLQRASADSNSPLFWDPAGPARPLPASVLGAAAAFAGYAALAAPAESLRATHQRTERAIRSWVRPDDRERVRTLVLLPISFQAQPALGLAALRTLHGPGYRFLAPWQALARGDSAAARGMIAGAKAATWANTVPAPDVFLQRAILALAVYDTAAAAATLDSVVVALPQLGVRLTEEVSPAAALPRSLLLRARLAGGDVAAASLRAAAASLWVRADPELRAAIDSLRPPSAPGRALPHGP